MGWVLLVLGIGTTATGWWLVRSRGVSVWRVMPPLYAALGVLAVIVGPPAAGRPRAWDGWIDGSLATSVAWAIASGIALYAATRMAVSVLVRWEPFARQAIAQYEPAGAVSLATAVALSLAVVVGEELLWRFAVQQNLGVDAALAAGCTWIAYIVANLASGSMPIVASAVAGGAVWGLAAWLSGGALAPILSHGAWTALMLVVPPGPARGKMHA